MITIENIELLKQLQANGETLEQAIEKGEIMLEIQNKREKSLLEFIDMSKIFRDNIQSGTYDDILGDVNAMIDRTQTLIQTNQEENA